jgi:hypothetical protein
MEAHDDTWDFTVMKITFKAALKTKYKAQVEESMGRNASKPSTSRRSCSFEARIMQKILLIPVCSRACSMVVKDKRDSKWRIITVEESILYWRQAGQLITDPTTCQPFDKTST